MSTTSLLRWPIEAAWALAVEQEGLQIKDTAAAESGGAGGEHDDFARRCGGGVRRRRDLCGGGADGGPVGVIKNMRQRAHGGESANANRLREVAQPGGRRVGAQKRGDGARGNGAKEMLERGVPIGHAEDNHRLRGVTPAARHWSAMARKVFRGMAGFGILCAQGRNCWIWDWVIGWDCYAGACAGDASVTEVESHCVWAAVSGVEEDVEGASKRQRAKVLLGWDRPQVMMAASGSRKAREPGGGECEGDGRAEGGGHGDIQGGAAQAMGDAADAGKGAGVGGGVAERGREAFRGRLSDGTDGVGRSVVGDRDQAGGARVMGLAVAAGCQP